MALSPDFVSAVGCGFLLNSQPFPVRGANCYYLSFASDRMAAAVFRLAASLDYNVIRTWAFLDRPRVLPGQPSFQHQDEATGAIVQAQGEHGLDLLDRTIALAEEYGTHLILPLVNYWEDFGGIDQYAQWLAREDKSTFFTDTAVMRLYRNYVESILLRTNTRTGRQYRDEPSILAWELINEPRCSDAQGVEILCKWADDMSSFLKALDPNHLLGVGDEGFLRRRRAGNNPLYNGAFGVDCERLLGLSNIDFGTCHLYPHYAALENSGSDPVEFGRRWIQEHIEAGQRAGKPMIIEEYGWPADDLRSTRSHAFRVWLDQVESSQGAGSLVWMIAGETDSGEPYPDYDGYTIYERV